MNKLNEQVEIMVLLKKTMIEFLDEMVNQIEDECESDLIVMRFFLSEQIPIEELMNKFIKFVLPHKELIITKNERFFLENENIFGSSPKDKVIQFKQVYLKMAPDDKETLWLWFSTFITICEKYISIK